MLTSLTIIAGLVILTLGADWLVRGATAIARRLNLSELLIGLTLVGFGTSTPELVSSVQASLQGASGIALGNVIGSNIANIFLIMGLTAVICPIAVDGKAFRRDAPALALATAFAAFAVFNGYFGRVTGAVFLLALALYLFVAYRTERIAPDSPETQRHEKEAANLPSPPASILPAVGFAIAGLAALILGAKMLISGAISIAEMMGVSQTLIGLTVVAIGTSLPELVTSTVAAMRGKSDIALGNVVGSNIYNLLGILGVTALIAPFDVAPALAAFDIWVMLGATALLLVFARSALRVSRVEGGLLFAAYVIYIGWLAANA